MAGTRYWLAAAALVALTLAAQPAGAEVYKWVDEEGVVHYSQQPPAEGESTVLEPKTAPPKPQQTTGGAPDEAGGDGEAETAAEAEQQQGAGTIDEFCRQARADIQTLEAGGRVRVEEADGSLRYLGPEEQQQRLQQLQQQVANNCEGGQ